MWLTYGSGSRVIFIGAVVVLLLVLFGYAQLTVHEEELTIKQKFIDLSDNESSYLVEGTDGKIVELQRPWYNLQDNIDRLYLNAEPGRQVTYECFGWVNDGWHWYSLCYKEI